MRQLSLFENQLPDVEPLLKAALNRAAKRSGLSREQIVDRMNDIAAASGFRLNRNARSLSLDVFEKWLNPAEREYMPGHNALHAFVLAVGDHEPLKALASLHGYALVGGEDLKILEAAKIEREIKSLKRKKRRLEQEL